MLNLQNTSDDYFNKGIGFKSKMSITGYESEILHPYSDNEDIKVCSLLVLYSNNQFKKLTREKISEIQQSHMVRLCRAIENF
jgi:hypothetical protein